MKFGWIILMISMLADVAACLMSKELDGLRRPGLLIAVVICFAFSMGAFAYCLRLLPIGPAFAVWSGLGLTLSALIAVPLYGQRIDLGGLIGMGLIIAGTFVFALYSKMQVH